MTLLDVASYAHDNSGVEGMFCTDLGECQSSELVAGYELLLLVPVLMGVTFFFLPNGL